MINERSEVLAMKRVIEQLKNEVEEMKTAHQRELYSMKSLQETVFSQLSLLATSHATEENVHMVERTKDEKENSDGKLMVSGSKISVIPLHVVQKQIWERMDGFDARFVGMGDRLTLIENQVSSIDRELDDFTERVDNLESQSRRDELVVHGLRDMPVFHPNTSSATKEKVWIGYMLDKINTIIPRQFRLTPAHISTAHPLRPRDRNNKTGIMIVKFSFRWLRNEIFYDRFSIRDRFVSITEHLTEQRMKLLKRAKLELGHENICTDQCQIFFMKNNRSYRIRCYSDIKNIHFEIVFIVY